MTDRNAPFGPLRLLLLVAAAGVLTLTSTPAWAGSYGPQLFSYNNGTTNLGDGTTIASSPAVAEIVNGTLRLTLDGTGGTLSSFKLPNLDPGSAITSFTAIFDVRIVANGQPADGFAFEFGAIPGGNGTGEAGFGSPDGLTVSFDTYPNAGEVTSIEVLGGGVRAADYPRDWSSSLSQWIEVTLHWDEATGLDLTFGSETLATGLAVPGFIPASGNRFAFSARTGGATESVFLDNLEITTTQDSPLLTGGPVITEFVAANQSRFEDEDFDTSDWLEIYNGKATSTNLAGYYLTDDPADLTKFALPSRTVPAFGYELVFASAKNRTPAAPGVIHTNFTIKKEGGYLALVAPDGTTVLSEFTFGEQADDTAFGELGSARTLGYLETPTPAAENRGPQAPGPPAETVDFLGPGGVFTGSVVAEIAPPVAAGAEVRYTLDNTVPTASSSLYTAPLNFTDTATVRARVFLDGHLPGNVRSRTFIELANDVASFSSDIPVVVAESFGVNIDAASGASRPYRDVYTVVVDTDEATGRAQIQGPVDFNGRGAMHVRGQSSAGFPKKQYAWETRDNLGEDDKVSILGFPDESDWILHAPYSDKTLMRNKVAYDVARELHGNAGGVRSRFVELFFNQDGGPVNMADYRGVYLVMEKIKRDPERVDIAKLNDFVTDPEMVTGGYIFKKDKEPWTMPWTTAREGIPLDTHDPEEPNAVQFAFLRDHVNDFEAALHSANFADPETGYAAFIDTLSFIDNHHLVQIFKEIDGFRISSYFSKDRGAKIKALPIWDYNLGLGNADYGVGGTAGENPVGWYLPGGTNYPWYNRLFQDTEFTLAYWDRYWELRQSVFDVPTILSQIDGYTSDLAEAQARNFQRWNVLGTYLWPNAAGYQNRLTHQAEVDWMKNWLTQRLSWIDSQSEGTDGFAQPPAFSQSGGTVEPGTTLTLSDPNGWGAGSTIYYTTDGSDPRSPSGEETIMVAENAALQALVPSAANGGAALAVSQWTTVAPPPNAANWKSGTQGTGLEFSAADTYGPFINTDVSEMYVTNATCYIRIPFHVAELGAFTSLKLRMRYDDSFAAYLNGTLVATDPERTPGTLTWNSSATDLHPDSDAVEWAEFDISPHLNALKVGDNMLAIHGLNESTTSSDALWQAQLVGVVGSVRTYSGPITINQSQEILARVHEGGEWTPLRRAAFLIEAVPAAAGNLVVSEVHYHPADPTAAELSAGFTDDGQFEFIELMNISGDRIDLTGVQFTNGIAFAFGPEVSPTLRDLAPGGHVVLVRDASGFAARYGTGMPVAGTYSGALANDGETLGLIDAGGTPIATFSFDDASPWPESPDGDGPSLVLVAPLADPDPALPQNWRASSEPGGTPGGSDAATFSGDPDSDEDGDGSDAFTEFAFGTSDQVPGPPVRPVLGAGTFTLPGGSPEAFLVLTFPRNTAADYVTYTVEELGSDGTWEDASANWVWVSTTFNDDGTASVQLRSTTPSDALPKRLILRIRAQAD